MLHLPISILTAYNQKIVTTKKVAKKNEPINILPAKPRKPLPKTLTEHTTLTFQNYRLEEKLLQELGEVMETIMSNADNSEICLFINFIWEQHHQLVFATIVRLVR